MNTTATVPATVEFALTALNPVVDEFSARLDAAGFPVIAVDLETGIVSVDAASDPDEYSVLMAASQAASAVGISEDDLLYAELSE